MKCAAMNYSYGLESSRIPTAISCSFGLAGVNDSPLGGAVTSTIVSTKETVVTKTEETKKEKVEKKEGQEAAKEAAPVEKEKEKQGKAEAEAEE